MSKKPSKPRTESTSRWISANAALDTTDCVDPSNHQRQVNQVNLGAGQTDAAPPTKQSQP